MNAEEMKEMQERVQAEMRIRKQEEAKETARGCVLTVVLFAGGFVVFFWWLASGPVEPEKTAARKEAAAKEEAALQAQTDATLERLAQTEQHPCADHGLYFFEGLFGTWYLTCGKGCAGIAASNIYPRAVLKALDEAADYSVRRRVKFVDLQKFVGRC